MNKSRLLVCLMLVVALCAVFCVGTKNHLHKTTSLLVDNKNSKGSNDAALEPPSADAGENKLLSTSVNVKILGFTCITFDAKATAALKKAFMTVLTLENVGNVEVELLGCKNQPKPDARRRRLNGFADTLNVLVTVNVGDPTKLLSTRELLVGMRSRPEKITEVFKTSLVDLNTLVPDVLSMAVTMAVSPVDKLVDAAKKASRTAWVA